MEFKTFTLKKFSRVDFFEVIPILIILISMSFVSGCDENSPTPRNYLQHIKPILDKHCIECHKPGGIGYDKSGFSVETYQTLLQGTRLGPVIIPGDALSSSLVLLIDGKADPAIKMPHGNREPLSRENIEAIKQWINEGAKKQ